MKPAARSQGRLEELGGPGFPPAPGWLGEGVAARADPGPPAAAGAAAVT